MAMRAPPGSQSVDKDASRLDRGRVAHSDLKPRHQFIPGFNRAAGIPTPAGFVKQGGGGAGNSAIGEVPWNLASIAVHTLSAPKIQTKLTINNPGDKHEQEADRIAEQVMGMAQPGMLPGAPSPAARFLQRKCACGGTCSHCEDQEKNAAHKHLQMKCSAATDTGRVFAPSSVHDVLRASGRPLDGPTRSFMEPRFGHDFSRVRVHHDAKAAATADSIGARAYTVGPHIAFAAGQFEPATRGGRQLLAHELAHVLQQTSGGSGGESSLARSIDERSPVQVTRSAPALQMQARGSAGGCGICLGGDSRAAGKIAHDEVQDAFKALDPDIQPELPVPVVKPGEKVPFVPEVDLAKESFNNLFGRVIEIGEIKPLDDAGTQLAVGRSQLGDYARELKFTYDEVFRLKSAPPTNIPFINPNNPPGCPPQIIEVQLTEPGIYQYYCEPSWSELVKDPRCKCSSSKQKEKKQQASAAKPVSKPEEKKKAQSAATKGHLYVESVDPYFRELAAQVPNREAAVGEEFIVAVNSDFYKAALAQKQAQEMERTKRLMSVDPRNVPMFQITAAVIPIARLMGVFDLGIALVGLVGLAMATLPEDAAVGGAGAAAGGAGTSAAATGTAATGAAEGGQVISMTARIAARAAARQAAAVTSEVVTAGKAAAAAAALLYFGTSSKDAEAATKPYVGKRMLTMIKITGSGDPSRIGEELTIAGQGYTVIMRLGSSAKP